MRRVWVLFFCLAVLCLPGRAEEAGYVALTFDGGDPEATQRLLEGLEDCGAKATFFLLGRDIREDPGQAEKIFRAGHEIGLCGYSGSSMLPMSRLQIAEELSDTRALLPKQCRPVWLRPPGEWGDAARQVAEVTRLAILEGALNASTRGIVNQIRDGDVVSLGKITGESVDMALQMADILRRRGLELVTVSQLAGERDVKIHPGKIYRKFPEM